MTDSVGTAGAEFALPAEYLLAAKATAPDDGGVSIPIVSRGPFLLKSWVSVPPWAGRARVGSSVGDGVQPGSIRGFGVRRSFFFGGQGHGAGLQPEHFVADVAY